MAKRKKPILGILLVVVGLMLGASIFLWSQLGSRTLTIQSDTTFRSKGKWTLEDLGKELQKQAGLEDPETFVTWARRLGYEDVKASIIELDPNDGVYALIKKFKANRRQTQDVVIQGGLFSRAPLTKAITNKIDIEPDSLLRALTDEVFLKKYGTDTTNWFELFLPNTYNFYMETSTEKFFARMRETHDKFWNTERVDKAKKQGLSKREVTILASIVSRESLKSDEYENIAGVYINRYRIGMLLQADPTVNYAVGRWGILKGTDLRRPHPYNTYLNKGLPPGPIAISYADAIDAVLDYGHHDYIFFCAKEDFSGYHNFAATLAEHNVNAAKWRKALREREEKKKDKT